jgi:hypothetical protein
MDQLLRDLNATAQRARCRGEKWLDPIVLAGYRAASQQIITLGNRQNPPPTERTGKRGVIKKTPPGTCSCAWTATANKSCASPTTSASRSTIMPMSPLCRCWSRERLLEG